MARVVKDWKPEKVEEATVAPHRYLWTGAILSDGSLAKELDLCKSYEEKKANMPYRPGEVIYILRGSKATKAKVYGIYWERNHYGELREMYRVQVETADGLWSKLWEQTYPGFIQRGYHAAGLAPDYRE